MKIPEQFPIRNLISKDRRGVALITVLTVMSLTTILVLTFFSLATSEHRASNTYSHGLQAQQVAEAAVNMVISQIREATTTEQPGDSLQNRIAWASQPGAIRRWTNTGTVDSLYKLYSDDTMKTNQSNEFSSDFSDLRGWSEKHSHFVDLNEPVIRGEKVYYPIVHPAASLFPRWPKPLDDDKDGVEGFSYDSSKVEGGKLGDKAARIAKADDGHLAMPVRWLYQLADGTVGTLSESGSPQSGYKFDPLSGNGRPSADNQIVARFAFWADDETNKLNLNTHAGGLAWDIPKAGGELDMAMGKYQPAQKEWQRYPGHPASTHLGPALSPGILDIVNDRDAMEMLYRVTPRVVGGGSESGTRLINTRDPAEENGLVPDKEPLFPSIDDMVMRSDREPHEYPDANGRAIPDEELSEYLERSKFFITAYSRAPEVNMFNLPRVAMWPIFNAPRNVDSGSDYQRRLTAFDRLIHYCSSVGGGSGDDRFDYIFRREKADSATYDAKIPRNAQIYAYLNELMESKFPGYGGTFATKFGSEGQDKLLTLIFDYIRATNLHDDTLYADDFARAFQKANNNEHWTFTNPRDGNDYNKGFGHKGHGQVTPIRIGNTKGMGRFFTLSSAEVMVSCVAEPGGRWPHYPGVNGYRGNGQQPPGQEPAFTNLPPLPRKTVKGRRDTYPQWLKNLEDGSDPAGRAGEFEAAFEPENWNWNLAFLDGTYLAAVVSDPTQNKFSRYVLGPDSEGIATRLLPGEKMAQGAFLFNLFCPHIGWNGINPDMQIDITANSGMVFNGAQSPYGTQVPFMGFAGWGDRPSDIGETDGKYRWATNWIKPHREGGVRAWGGLLPFTFAFQARDVLLDRAFGSKGSVWWHLWDGKKGNPANFYTTSGSIRSRLTPIDRGYDYIEEALTGVEDTRNIGKDVAEVAQAYRYDLVTIPFKVSGAGIDFSGGEVYFEIFDGGSSAEASYQDDEDESTSNTLVQEITLDFPSFQFATANPNFHVAPPSPGGVNEFNDLSRDSTRVLEYCSVTADPGNPYDTPKGSAQMEGGTWDNNIGRLTKVAWNDPRDGESLRGLNVRGRMADSAIHWGGPYVHRGDIVQSVAITHGDARLVAADPVVEINEHFAPHRNYANQPMAHSLTDALGRRKAGFNGDSSSDFLIVPTLGKDPYRNKTPLPFATDKSTDVQFYGDFDNGAGTMIDGPYVNKPDEGNVHALKTKFTQEIVHHWEALRNYGDFPYFSNPEKAEAGGPSYFSPNRIISGPGMLGSLPTGLESGAPWQTLLFRPNVVGGNFKASHPGAETPPDHLIMDLFWMPVVEPYAISEPLSTGGKVNMNFQLVPFLHVDRTTALRGVFRSEFMLCIPNKFHHSYKHNRGRGKGYHWRDNPTGGELQGLRLRTVILESPTLDQFKTRFKDGRDAFRSSSEICDIHLIPEEVVDRLQSSGSTGIGSYTPRLVQMENGKYWSDHVLVGDNSRERPYANIQQRLTTKSNTFKVHYRAQVVKQARRDNDSEYAVWKPEVDTIQAEYRGSSIVERFVDPNDDRIPDFASDTSESLSEFYQYRVVNPRRFAP